MAVNGRQGSHARPTTTQRGNGLEQMDSAGIRFGSTAGCSEGTRLGARATPTATRGPAGVRRSAQQQPTESVSTSTPRPAVAGRRNHGASPRLLLLKQPPSGQMAPAARASRVGLAGNHLGGAHGSACARCRWAALWVSAWWVSRAHGRTHATPNARACARVCPEAPPGRRASLTFGPAWPRQRWPPAWSAPLRPPGAGAQPCVRSRQSPLCLCACVWVCDASTCECGSGVTSGAANTLRACATPCTRPCCCAALPGWARLPHMQSLQGSSAAAAAPGSRSLRTDTHPVARAPMCHPCAAPWWNVWRNQDCTGRRLRRGLLCQ
jgi:hypothetical protein